MNALLTISWYYASVVMDMEEAMPRGKELSADVREVVVHLKQHFDNERKSARSVSTKDPFGGTAVALGIGVATVKRIVSYYKRTGTVLTGARGKPGRRLGTTCQSIQVVARDFVRSQNLLGKRVSVEKLRYHLTDEHGVEVDKSTLWRALKRWGFTFGAGRRRVIV